MEVVKNSTNHPGVDEIYLRTREKMPHVSLGTVYRNLEQLSEQGYVQKLEIGNEPKRFDPNPAPHNHFKCSSCGAVEDLPFVSIKRLQSEFSESLRGHRIEGYQLTIYGLCSRCTAEQGFNGVSNDTSVQDEGKEGG
ncbi:MAG: transcriptional repressor [Spirochaetales bacterium]|nr:transcriptional repressor [Spirochaetales bacterium]MCF7937032.1 transcriptional repressor [Spirochaetales bacterium]